MASDYAKLRRLAAARAVVSILAGMDDEDSDGTVALLTGDDDAEESCGITLSQRLRLIDIVDGHGNGPELAAALTEVITANHGDTPFASSAAGIDLLRTLRDIERLTRMNEQATVDVITKATPGSPDAFGAATEFMSRLREIGRIVNPLVALLDSASRADVHAVAAE